MTLSIETLARIISAHYNDKQTTEVIESLEGRISECEDTLKDMRKDLGDIQSARETIDDLMADIEDEMTVDERMNFKRLTGIE